jgi:hypothetical protein
MRTSDERLLAILSQLSMGACDVLRRAARAEQVERDELAIRLLREGAVGMADFVDRMSLDLSLRRQVVRVVGVIQARQAG